MLRRSLVSLAALSFFSVGASIAACSTETVVHQAAPTPPVATEEPDAAEPVDASVPDTAPPKPKPKLTFPEVQSRGGPVIKAPKVLPILFPGDPLASSITSFTSKIATSQYWKDVGAQYQVGAMTALPTITVTEAAPTTITSPGIETWLQGKLSGASPAFGAPDENTLYAIYYPASTTITDDGTGLGQSCQAYGGYHYETDVTTAGGGKKSVAFAVMPRCSDVDELTVAASHEYFEWATDPFPLTKPAFARLDDNHWAWQVAMIGELGDLCTYLDRDNLRPPEVGFLVQRMWSNTASLAGKYPCAPAKTSPYLQAITEAEDLVDVPDYGDQTKTITTKAVRVPPGGTRTVDALVYSDQPGTPVVPLRALSYADFGNGGAPSGFTFELSQNNVKVGNTVKVTISAPSKSGFDILVMAAYTGQDSAHYWPVVIVNDDAPAAQGKHSKITAEMLPKFALSSLRGTRPFTRLGLGQQHRGP